MRVVVKRILNRFARWRVAKALPGVLDDLANYTRGSATTGTQWITLWFAIRIIFKHRPKWVLECGTGSSTLVLAAALRRVHSDGGPLGRIVSMESEERWYETAVASLPSSYSEIVEIVYGPRVPMNVAMFRGFIHGNIPGRDFEFVFLDGPNYQSEEGVAFCADIFRVMDLSAATVIRGVIDGRVTSVYVLQQLCGVKAVRYWKFLHAATFTVRPIVFRDPSVFRRNFGTTLFGRVDYRKFWL